MAETRPVPDPLRLAFLSFLSYTRFYSCSFCSFQSLPTSSLVAFAVPGSLSLAATLCVELVFLHRLNSACGYAAQSSIWGS